MFQREPCLPSLRAQRCLSGALASQVLHLGGATTLWAEDYCFFLFLPAEICLLLKLNETKRLPGQHPGISWTLRQCEEDLSARLLREQVGKSHQSLLKALPSMLSRGSSASWPHEAGDSGFFGSMPGSSAWWGPFCA